jgi:hypothetical protein
MSLLGSSDAKGHLGAVRYNSNPELTPSRTASQVAVATMPATGADTVVSGRHLRHAARRTLTAPQQRVLSEFDLVVIGAGATGLAAARAARKAGRSVALVEKARPGGDCTHYGCVPSKTLLDIAHRVSATR